MQNSQTASLDSCKCPCICLFDCCFIQQFLFTTPLAKLTRNPELSPLLIIVTSCDLGECTLDKILLNIVIYLAKIKNTTNHNFLPNNAIHLPNNAMPTTVSPQRAMQRVVPIWQAEAAQLSCTTRE